MTPESKQSFLAHAQRVVPHECCGVLLEEAGVESYVEVSNIESDSMRHFTMSHEELAELEERGTISAICHSHPDGMIEPSEADKVSCEESGLPWYIISPQTGNLYTLAPTGYKAPYELRPFVHGVLDCYSLIKDFYAWELGIDLPNFERDDFWWMLTEGPDLYLDNFESAGFVRIPYENEPAEVLQKHDVILMEVRSPFHKINHGAIWIDTLPNRGGNLILQHLQNQPSGYTVYGGYWRKCTRMVLRHRSLLSVE